jgi:hypothetical protein
LIQFSNFCKTLLRFQVNYRLWAKTAWLIDNTPNLLHVLLRQLTRLDKLVRKQFKILLSFLFIWFVFFCFLYLQQNTLLQSIYAALHSLDQWNNILLTLLRFKIKSFSELAINVCHLLCNLSVRLLYVQQSWLYFLQTHVCTLNLLLAFHFNLI